MTEIRPATQADLPAIAELVARLQADPAHHIGFLGVTVEEVTEEITGLPGWPEGAAVAIGSSGALRGVLITDINRELRRGWLYGPFVDVPSGHPAAPQSWDTNADALYREVRARPALQGIDDLDLYGHIAHRQLAEFAVRHGFSTKRETRILTLAGADLRSLIAQDIDCVEPLPADDPRIREEVAVLLERAFPNRTRSTEQLLSGEEHTVVILKQANGSLAGFAAGYTQLDEYLVDYVAVEPEMRCVGVGGKVVRGLLRELDARNGARRQAAAVVAHENDASARMFTKLGFGVELELVSYRRQP
ncbi:GNAT family N-acetyltransferase [Actinocrispum sp. NPDC049592]|uniref:GNAT family N-acetyltransferase n=1 Tax=Actinocrispum sp. NPDC049592 TaxID=3154835 RepID=UPI00343A3747